MNKIFLATLLVLIVCRCNGAKPTYSIYVYNVINPAYTGSKKAFLLNRYIGLINGTFIDHTHIEVQCGFVYICINDKLK
jgi:hypothetical protein